MCGEPVVSISKIETPQPTTPHVHHEISFDGLQYGGAIAHDHDWSDWEFFKLEASKRAVRTRYCLFPRCRAREKWTVPDVSKEQLRVK